MKEYITSPDKFKKMKEKIKEGSYQNLHVLSDFDRTLTYGTTAEGEKRPSLISVLRNGDYLDQDYAEKAHALFDKYHPIEMDPDLSHEKKKRAMQEWWETHNELLIEKGLSKNHFRDIIEEGGIEFREGVPEFLDFLNKKQIPLVIMSASGAGEAVPMFFEEEEKKYSNIYFIVNRFNWDSHGRAISHKEPIIHSLNKDETVLEEFPEIYEKVKDRKDVILSGDTLSDVDMIEGFDFSQLLKIGFLCYKIEKNREGYKQAFDVVLEGDGDFKFINGQLFEIN